MDANFVGARNGFETKYDTLIDLKAYTVQLDSSVTSNLSAFAIGAIYDPVFGITQASLITQIGLPGVSNFHWGDTSIKQLDSVVLQLRFRNQQMFDGTYLNDYYGDKNAVHTLNVYKITEDLSWDSSYFSRRNFVKENTPVGSWTGKFNFTDSTKISLDSPVFVLPPHIRITMNNSFRDELYNAEKDGFFVDAKAFKNKFKGFAIIDETNLMANSGAIVFVKLNSDVTSLTAYHGSTYHDFTINPGYEASYNHYAHKLVPADLLQNLNFPLSDCKGQHHDTGYVQSLGGSKLRIEFPNLFTYFSNPKLVLNGAEIVFTVLAGSSNTMFTIPKSMLLFGSDSLGRYTPTLDAYESATYYGGLFNTNYNQYRFKIARHLQFLLDQYKKGNNFNYGMNLILSPASPVSADRVLIDTRKNSGTFKLKLTYTVIK